MNENEQSEKHSASDDKKRLHPYGILVLALLIVGQLIVIACAWTWPIETIGVLFFVFLVIVIIDTIRKWVKRQKVFSDSGWARYAGSQLALVAVATVFSGFGYFQAYLTGGIGPSLGSESGLSIYQKFVVIGVDFVLPLFALVGSILLILVIYKRYLDRNSIGHLKTNKGSTT